MSAATSATRWSSNTLVFLFQVPVDDIVDFLEG
jgi:hypothetical protein